MDHVIVVGGGLSGLSAAHTILERGGRVVVLDKMAFLGGNSVKATSGINGGLTSSQVRVGIKDSRELFYNDTARSAGAGLRPHLVKVLTHGSAPAVEWLQDGFGIDLSIVGQMGAHTARRTHRGKARCSPPEHPPRSRPHAPPPPPLPPPRRRSASPARRSR